MITNNTITATISQSPLFWNPDTVFHTTLLTAFLVTVLSYQATSFVYDLLLGLKPRHQSPAPHLHSLLLADESSPLSICAAILRNNTLDQLRFGLPQTTVFTRASNSTTKSTLIRLLLLLACAPIINIIAVAIALETDKNISFADANVKLALGVTENFVKQHPYIRDACDRLQDSFQGDVTAQFFICEENVNFRPLLSRSEQSKLTIIGSVQGDIKVEMFIKGANTSVVMNRHADVSIHPRSFRLAHALNDQIAAALAKEVAKEVDAACDTPDDVFLPPDFFSRFASASSGPASSDSLPSDSPQSSQRQAVPQLTVPRVVSEIPLECETVQPRNGRAGIGMIVGADRVLTRLVTVVDVDNFLLADAGDISRNVTISPTWIRGDDMPVIKIRSPIAPVPWIAIAIGAVLLLRLIVELTTNNDVADGVEAVVAAALGFQDGYELVRSNHTVRYDRKLQRGELLHYGKAKPGWEEVVEFSRSVGVLWQDERDEESYYDGKLKAQLDDHGSGDTGSA